MNNRRRLLIALGACASVPRTVFPQTKKLTVVIGWLGAGLRPEAGAGNLAEFKKELATLGWKEGANYVLEELHAAGQPSRLPALAEELAAKKPALLVTTTVASTRAAVDAAPNTPIVVIGSADLVASGLAASHARPGGMITGIGAINAEIAEKYLELLIQAGSKPRRVGFLFWSAAGTLLQHKDNVRRSVARYTIEEHTAEVARPEEIEPTLKRLAKEGIQALVVMSNAGPLATERKNVVKFALEQRWPVIGGALWADEGALLSYSADSAAVFRRGAHLVARILKGAKPADLPIERPMTFELVVNLKTARALALTLPPEIMVQATRVIQ
jgi:putative ABC transport system substrate-binding protein